MKTLNISYYVWHINSILGQHHHNSAIHLKGKSYTVNKQLINSLEIIGQSSPLSPILNKLKLLVQIRPFKLTPGLANRIGDAHFEELGELVYTWTRDKSLNHLTNYYEMVEGSTSCFITNRGNNQNIKWQMIKTNEENLY